MCHRSPRAGRGGSDGRSGSPGPLRSSTGGDDPEGLQLRRTTAQPPPGEFRDQAGVPGLLFHRPHACGDGPEKPVSYRAWSLSIERESRSKGILIAGTETDPEPETGGDAGAAALEVLTKALDVSVGDEAGGEAEEGFVDVVASFPADAETAEAVQPGDGPLDDPAVDAEAGAVWDAAAGDHRFDALRPDETAVFVVVVAAVGQQRVRSSPGSSDQAGDGRDLGEQGSSWVTSLRFPPVSDTASGMPCPSTRTWCLLPGRARSTGLGPLLGRVERPGRGWSRSPPATSPAAWPSAAS